MKTPLGLSLALLLSPAVVSAEPLPPVRQWIPQQAVLVLEITKPAALLDPLLSPDMAKAIKALPAYQQLSQTPKFRELLGVVAHLETELGLDWQTGLRQLLSGGVTFAVGPGGETLLSIDAADAQILVKLQDRFLRFARAEAAKQNDPERVFSKEYHGVTGWSFGPKEAHVIVGHRLLISNRPAVLKAVLDLRDEPGGSDLASLPAYEAAQGSLSPGTVATLFVNMERLRENPGIQRALTHDANPLAALLFASVRNTLRQTPWLALGMHIEGDNLVVRASADRSAAQADGSAQFALPSNRDEGVLPTLHVPRYIAGLSLYRDLHGFYAAKDQLFPERTSGLIFFENMMGIFFSGLDLTEEVFGQIGPEIRLVAAGQRYDPAAGVPAVKFPAFAAVFRLREPDRFGQVMEEAWQKALGLINFTRGQKALPGLIIDREVYQDTKFSVAYYRPPAPDATGDVHLRYNFRPALARCGDCLILSSTDGLVKDLLDALKAKSGAPLQPIPSTHSLAEVDGAHLLSILLENRENLLRQNMVQKGHTREQAVGEVDFLLTILDAIPQAKLSFQSEQGRPQAVLQLQLRVPDTGRLRESRWRDTASVTSTPGQAGPRLSQANRD